MITPTPAPAFHWRDTAYGPALVCLPLEREARHLFTTRGWALGAAAAAGADAWSDVARALERDPSMLVRLRQVHGAEAVNADTCDRSLPLPAADMAIGRDAQRVLAVQAADCVPLLIADGKSGAVAAAHAGWRGLVQRVPARAVERLCETFGTVPGDLMAAAGPSIGACCYEVGSEVKEAFAAATFDARSLDRWFASTATASSTNPSMPGVVVGGRPGHWFFDGWQCVRDQLVAAGIPSTRIFVAEVCTASHPQLLCSYRRDGVRAGRISGAIVPDRR